MKGSACAFFVLAIVAAHCCARKTLAGDTGSSATGKVLKQGVGSLVSEWYLSLKTSKGYCGLVTATEAAGGYGFAIVCNNKYPQYGSTFAVLLPDSNGGGGHVSGIDTVAAAVQGEAAARGRASTGSSLTDASAPLIVSSGREVRVLARSAGQCNTPPVPSSGGMDREQPSVSVMGGLAAMARVIHSWMYSWRCAIPGTKEADGFSSRRWWLKGCRQGQTGLTQDLPPRPVICALGQPSGMSYKIFKANLKDGESVDLDKEWIYLKEGDKYCTLADVAGMNAVVSCHLDAPGWSGYKFQIQRLSYPRSQLHSLLTGSPCGVRLPGLPGLHDMECQGGEQAGRAPEVDLVLQTPGSQLAAGVVVGLSTFSPGLMGVELQRCCAHPASPHIILCEPPPPGPVANECWFQMYDVKIAASPLTEDSAGTAAKNIGTGKAGDDSEHAAVGLVPTTDKTDPWVEVAPEQVGTGFGSFLPSFLRALQLEMSPVGLDSNLESESEFAAVISRAAVDDTRVRHRSLLSRLWLESGMRKAAAVGEAEGNVEAEDEGEKGVSERYRRWLLSGEGDWNPDGRPDPQPSMLLEGRDGGSDDPSVSGVEMAEVVDIDTNGNATLAQVTRTSALADRKDDRLRSGPVTVERTADAMAVEPAPLTGLGPARKQWELLWWLWPTRFVSVSCGKGVRDAAVGAAAPLGDRSLVMLMNRAFGRYCSVSLDGTLLCISAQASNASRNLFTLFMPSIPGAVAEAVAGTVAETVAGAAVTTVEAQG